MIKEYLQARAAIGKDHAIGTKDIMEQYHMRKRAIVRQVAKEREAGALICSTTTKGGGYFLPATMEEITKERDKMEKGIAYRAMALRPFRAAVKQQAAVEGAASSEKA